MTAAQEAKINDQIKKAEAQHVLSNQVIASAYRRRDKYIAEHQRKMVKAVHGLIQELEDERDDIINKALELRAQLRELQTPLAATVAMALQRTTVVQARRQTEQKDSMYERPNSITSVHKTVGPLGGTSYSYNFALDGRRMTVKVYDLGPVEDTY